MDRYPAVLALAFSLAPVYAQQLLNPPLKNWPAPLYWAPTPAEAEQQRIEQRMAQRGASPLAQPSSIFTAPGPMTFIAMTPCRVMDTRTGQGFTGAFGPPSLAANVARQVPMPTSTTCSIPSNAGAYSLNITAVSPGILSFLSVWPAGAAYPGVSTLNDTSPTGGAIANAAIVPAGTLGAIQMLAGNITDVIIDINGYYAAPTDGNSNTAIGLGALVSNTTGSFNTASGSGALQNNTTGDSNTASGAGALSRNTTGGGNTADGDVALANNTTGLENTASGFQALFSNTTGSDNTANGVDALQFNTTGSNNTASGVNALISNTTGSDNTANGFDALEANTTGGSNTATGFVALGSNTTGTDNTANGFGALAQNTTGTDNTATGFEALAVNTTGGSNTATGLQALFFNTTGSNNTASGVNALSSNTTGSMNTATGSGAMDSNTTGGNNTALGTDALLVNTTGNGNIAIGVAAAFSVGAGNSNNIEIGSMGASTDGAAAGSGVIRIGTAGNQASFFAAGITGVNVSGANVVVSSSGQLGVAVSSQRFKEDIQDMGDSSSGLLRLRPVTFRYKQAYEDGSKPMDYGLIAEEVAQVYPDLAVKGPDGQIETIQYQKLTPMLLNELQKQAEQIRSLEDRLAALEALLSGAAPSPAAGDH